MCNALYIVKTGLRVGESYLKDIEAVPEHVHILQREPSEEPTWGLRRDSHRLITREDDHRRGFRLNLKFHWT